MPKILAPTKSTPVDADELVVQDSANSSSWVRVTLSNLRSYLNGYFARSTLGGSEKSAALSATTGTATGDCSAASVFTVTPTGTVTLAFSNVPASGTACTVTVIVTQGATPQTINLPSGGVWLAAAPTQTASKACIITLLTVDGGTTWYASGVVQA